MSTLEENLLYFLTAYVCVAFDTLLHPVPSCPVILSFYDADKLDLNKNIVAMWNVPHLGRLKLPKTRRQLQICNLFGGKKDNKDNSDDAPSKVWCPLTLLFVLHYSFLL